RTMLANPTVTSASFDYAHNPQTISFTFDQDVSGSLSTSDLYLRAFGSDTRQSTSSYSKTYNSTTNTATFTRLSDGVWRGWFRAELRAAAVTNASNEPLADDGVLDYFFADG